MKVSVIIAAAGSGTRFGGKRNKVLEKLKGRAVFLHSLELFGARDDVEEIILVVHPAEREEIAEKFGPNISFMNAKLVDGGTSRTQSIRNALAALGGESDFVAIHDGARPCISQLWVDDIFAEAEKTGAAIPATPVFGTLKRVASETVEQKSPQILLGGEPLDGGKAAKTIQQHHITATVDRDSLWQAQTPQVFERQLIIKAYDQSADSATDDAALVEALGHKVAVVPGDIRNIKITTPGDLQLAAAFIDTLPKPKPKNDANPFGEAIW